ncbi:MAG: glutamyl-tRNA reductase [Methanocorpusculaceae archaeon]|nr:glutamyl-tRNA reductase [Methanocorpusculaceae archaeon]
MSSSLSLAVLSHEKHSSAELADQLFDEGEFYKTVSSPCLLLQTCNRIEILSRESGDALSAFLESQGKEGFTILEGEDVLLHLLELAAGTKSLIVGEDQILGQMKKALLTAEEAGCVDDVISACITAAVRFGVLVRQKTAINRGAVSVGSAAVLLAEEELGGLDGRNILVVGGGETGKLVARALSEKDIKAIYVANRSYETAAALAAEIGGRAMRLDQMYSCLAEADVVISCTSAPHEIIRAEPISKIMEKRLWPLDDAPRKLLMIDIASPPDIEYVCADISGVSLYTIDDLKGISKRNLASRKKEIRTAEELIREYLPEYIRIIKRTSAGDVLSELYSWAEDIRARETEKALRAIRLGGDAEEVLEKFSLSLTKKLLDDTSCAVRRFAEESRIDKAKSLVTTITARKP